MAVEYVGKNPTVGDLTEVLRNRTKEPPQIRTPRGSFLVSYRRLSRPEREKLGLNEPRYAIHIEGIWRTSRGAVGQVAIEDYDGDGELGQFDTGLAFFESTKQFSALTNQDYAEIRNAIFRALGLIH